MTTLLFLLIAAEVTGDITLPWAAWVAIGGALTTAATILFRTYRSSVEANAAQTAQLVRECVSSMTTTNELLRQHADLLRQLMEERGHNHA